MNTRISESLRSIATVATRGVAVCRIATAGSATARVTAGVATLVTALVGSALVGDALAKERKGAALQANVASPTLADLEWLVGTWHGEGLGGYVEEHWTAAAGGTMMGAFRLVAEGELRVIEYMMITQEDDRVAYRFKHFNSDYSTWEKDRPLEFTLIRVSDREAVFHSEVPEQNSPRRLTYRLESAGELVVRVEGSDENGELTEGFEVRFRKY